ncbi:MAG: peptidoglycan-binding domain-containing protein [Patescibacteria group bacterium]
MKILLAVVVSVLSLCSSFALTVRITDPGQETNRTISLGGPTLLTKAQLQFDGEWTQPVYLVVQRHGITFVSYVDATLHLRVNGKYLLDAEVPAYGGAPIVLGPIQLVADQVADIEILASVYSISTYNLEDPMPIGFDITGLALDSYWTPPGDFHIEGSFPLWGSTCTVDTNLPVREVSQLQFRVQLIAPRAIVVKSKDVMVGKFVIDATEARGDIMVSTLPLILASHDIPVYGLTNCVLEVEGEVNKGIISSAQPARDISIFAVNMMAGSANDDVFYLQQCLNSNPNTRLASEGPGSPGMETFFFGELTQAAVKRFQILNGIPNTGFVGPLTRAALNSQLITNKASVVNVTFDTPLKIARGTSVTLTLRCSLDASVQGGSFSWGLADASAAYDIADAEFIPNRGTVNTIIPQSRISSVHRDPIPNTSLTAVYLQGYILPNTTYAVEASTNLIDWIHFGTVSPADSNILKEYVGAIEAETYRDKVFFRLKELP